MITLEQVSRKLYQDSYKNLEAEEKQRVQKATKEARQEVKKIVRTFKPRQRKLRKCRTSRRR